jgi:hypothetical protein
MVYKEAEKIAYNLHPLPNNKWKSFDEMLEIGEKLARQQMVFDNIPESQRIKTFRINRNESVIEDIKKRIEEARGVYNQYKKQLTNQI